MTNKEIIELFTDIINKAYEFAEAKISIEENNQKKNLCTLFHDYRKYVEKINKKIGAGLLPHSEKYDYSAA